MCTKYNQIKDIVEINIFISKTMVEFGSSLKIFNGKFLEKRSSFDTNIIILNQTSIFIPPDLATLIQ